jgi:tetratricopeptide (TPR) repeat protein
MSSLHEQAEAAEAIGQLQNALELWEKVCRTDPDPATLCKLGRLRQKLGQWQPAEEALLAALAIDRSFTIAMLFLGILNMHREDIEHDAAMQQAATWLEKAIALEPSAMAHTLLGVTFCHRRDPESARQAFKRAIELDDEYEEAYYNLAGLPDTNPERKRDLYQKAIHLDPDYALAHQRLGVIEHKQKNLPAAEYHFRRAVELDTLDVFSHLYLANLLAVKRDAKGAEAEFRAALVVDSPHHLRETAEFFAVFLDRLGRHDEAEQVRSANTSSS